MKQFFVGLAIHICLISIWNFAYNVSRQPIATEGSFIAWSRSKSSKGSVGTRQSELPSNFCLRQVDLATSFPIEGTWKLIISAVFSLRTLSNFLSTWGQTAPVQEQTTGFGHASHCWLVKMVYGRSAWTTWRRCWVIQLLSIKRLQTCSNPQPGFRCFYNCNHDSNVRIETASSVHIHG